LVREPAIILKNLLRITEKGWFSSYRFGPEANNNSPKEKNNTFYRFFGKVYATESG